MGSNPIGGWKEKHQGVDRTGSSRHITNAATLRIHRRAALGRFVCFQPIALGDAVHRTCCVFVLESCLKSAAVASAVLADAHWKHSNSNLKSMHVAPRFRVGFAGRICAIDSSLCARTLAQAHAEFACPHTDIVSHSHINCMAIHRHCVRVVKEMDFKSIGLCLQGFEPPRCRI